jgi:hypothetical protein
LGTQNPNMQCFPHAITLTASTNLLRQGRGVSALADVPKGTGGGGGGQGGACDIVKQMLDNGREGHGDRGQRSEECEVVGIRECVVASTAHVLVSLDYCQVCVHVCVND